MGVKPQEKVGVINLQRLKSYPPHASKDYDELSQIWPTPAEIWTPIPLTSSDVKHTNTSASSVAGSNRKRFAGVPVRQLWKYPNYLKNAERDSPAQQGRWLPLDVAFDWSQKRGSPQPKNLNSRTVKLRDIYSSDVADYNENMQKYLNAYLIEDLPTQSNVIYLATSFQTKDTIYHPVFMRFQFNQDLKQWQSSATARNPDFKGNLIELKNYSAGRGNKIGLFTNADAVTTLGYTSFKATLPDMSTWNEYLDTADDATKGEIDFAYMELKRLIVEGEFNVSQFFSLERKRWHWVAWHQDKTLTTKANRNQIYIWIPTQKEKYSNPANQLGLFNWTSAFWERKD